MTVWWPPPEVPEPEPCGRIDEHDSHDWQDDGAWEYCPGSDGELPPRWRRQAESDSGLLTADATTAFKLHLKRSEGLPDA